jgi:cytochrome b561
MVEAICIFTHDLGLLSEKAKGWKVTAHWFLQSLGLFAAAFGFIAVYYNKDLFSKPHFMSWHAWIGLAAIGMTILQVGMGLGTKHA